MITPNRILVLFSTSLSWKFGKNSFINSFPFNFEKLAKYFSAWTSAPYFALLKNIANELSLKNTSMGMSSDYEDAIYLGATSIRIGSRIFGERKKLLNNNE